MKLISKLRVKKGPSLRLTFDINRIKILTLLSNLNSKFTLNQN